jgi:hypothetical protein
MKRTIALCLTYGVFAGSLLVLSGCKTLSQPTVSFNHEAGADSNACTVAAVANRCDS